MYILLYKNVSRCNKNEIILLKKMTIFRLIYKNIKTFYKPNTLN